MSEPGRDFIGIGVGAVVAESLGQLFLARRGPAARNEVGCWEYPGGGVKFGEELEHAVVREFAEEYGMQIEVHGLLGVFNHILPSERQHWVSVTYLARRTGGSDRPLESDKCDATGWFSPAELPTPLSAITASNAVAWEKARDKVANFMKWVRQA